MFTFINPQWWPYMEAKGAFFPPVFFYLPLFENLTSVKIFSYGFYTLYLLCGLKYFPPLNFKPSPPLFTLIKFTLHKGKHPSFALI